MLYQFKQQLDDFVVEEMLPELPSGRWDVFYVFFEKKNLTTMEVIEYLWKQLHLSREELGIAWLKDKAWITRQWITIYKSVLTRIGGESVFLNCLSGIVTVLDTSWWEDFLRVWTNSWNRFFVRMRAQQLISQEVKNQIEQNICLIQSRGFPNCFGSQRFGKRNKNFWEAQRILSETLAQKADYRLRFMLQAYASMYFNEYVMNRWQKSLFLLGGDIVVDRYYAKWARLGVYQNQKIHLFDYLSLKQETINSAFFEPWNFQNILPFEEKKRIPTWPMLWWNLLLAPKNSKARIRDDLLLELAEYNEQVVENFKLYQLWGIRRPLWVYMDDLEWSFEEDDLLLNFSLPTGSYATVLLAFVLKDIDSLTLRDNRLEIPRIEKSLNS